ncbi:MAG: amidohydrolase family protein [Acidimicrobiales bacterium]
MSADAHHQVWDLAARDQPWITGPDMATIRRSFSIDHLANHADAAGVTATILVQTVVGPDETPELLAIAEASDLVAAVTGWADLTAPGVADTIAALQGGWGGTYLRAVRHQVQAEPDPKWLIRPDVNRGLAALIDHAQGLLGGHLRARLRTISHDDVASVS